ncbi:aluminum-activated malate transporter 7 [Phtheirospermum japonicum]|uniref:Aluminum-activated malate transporter 7 n=1 Tax=Phtheirospermum japonicum TaxID=374723 RepID=A0A830CC15_9LAMI|nr:aluminum-activated malate transporter 7 [Phtheirospermum japonicum]
MELAKVEGIFWQIKKIARDDPRRLIHSLKVGLALTLVSLFYYFEPLYSSFGVSAMWAVMTVVVVFEFSVGATLGKGLNRGLATLLAGGLGLGAHHLASVSGKTCEPILIGLFVFLQAVASTFIRFFPTVKARYDYGMLIFILTFCLVSISGLKTDEILGLAQKRLSTIVIGASTCLVVSIFVYPVWAGEDLHNLVANNIEKIGCFLEGFADECLRTCEESENNGKSISSLGCLNSVLDSKSNVETLANFARWEPGHGLFMYRHPWKQYLKIASLTRQCACRVEALKGYLNSKTQFATQAPLEIQAIISTMSSESGKALKELAWSVETMTKPCQPNPRATNLKIASKNLNSMLKSDFWEEHTNLLQVIPVAAVASLLNDTVASVENIADAIDELSSLANFKFHDSISSNNISLVSVVIDGGGTKSSTQAG